MPNDSLANPTLTPEEAQYLDRACDAFEAGWRGGARPSLEEALDAAPARVRPELLRELVQVEFTYRQQHGENPDPDEFRRRFADYRTDAFQTLRLGATPDRSASPLTLSGPLISAAPGAWPTIPGYEIVEELGRGGMGVVYKAKQLAADRQGTLRLVALKMILNGVHAGSEHRRRFKIEAEAAARFQHPNLVPIYEVGEHAGQLYFSMAFAEGGSLDKLLLNSGPLDAKRAATMAHTLAGALQCAHDNQIVHRDLKPANVVLAADGQPRITDFGLAKRLDHDSRVTLSDALLGTAAYMAPEQAEGLGKQVGEAADIYSLGAILYELLTGRPPFHGETWMDTIAQVKYADPVSPRQVRATIPADLETICLKCLEKKQEKRYASARALADDLERFLAGEPVDATAVTDLERHARWAVRAGFEIEEVLTYGVRDIVYRARQILLNRPVALKILADQPDPNVLIRLRREAETVACLDHPNIARIHNCGEEHGRTFLAFEYVAGGSLTERFADQALPPADAVSMVRKLADAVHHAHQRGVVHGALKPSSVLLTMDGVPKITNFGLATLQETSALERRPAFRRLPNYSAPEIVDSQSREAGPTIDVYSLGAILFTLLTGSPPFRGQTLADTIDQVRSLPPPAPSTARPDLAPVLDDICRKCMAKKPQDRYASAGELGVALADFLTAAEVAVLSRDATPHLHVDLSDLRIGQEPIPGYRLSKHLMSYDRGHIYKADGPGGFPVALQFKPRSQNEHQRLIDKSVDLMQTIHHPHLLSIFGVWRLEKAEIVATEFADTTLEDRLQLVRQKEQMGIGPDELLQYMEDAAKGIDFLNEPRHALVGRAGVSVVHGDIKPSNLRLVGGRVKVAEFVFAECLNLAHPDWECRNDVRGTLAYMAPERVRGETSIQTDQYSLAPTYFYLRTGRVLLDQRQETGPQLIGIEQEERRVLIRALAREPMDRWPNCRAFIKALQESYTR